MKLEAPAGYRFKVSHAKVEQYANIINAARIQLWRTDPDIAGLVDSEYVNIDGYSEEEILVAVKEKIKNMTRRVEATEHAKSLIQRLFNDS